MTDRRQPAVRWSAVLAGSAVAVGLWGVLQMLGVGAGLTALNPDDLRSMHGSAIGTGVWSFIAPLIALFVGGYVAGRLANAYDQRVVGTHGLIVWGLTAVVGMITSVWMVSSLANDASRGADRNRAMSSSVDQSAVDTNRDALDALAPINARLRTENKPQISSDELLSAVRRSTTKNNSLDRDHLAKELADSTSLSKADTDGVVRQLGTRTDDLVNVATRPSPQQRDALQAAENTGHALLALSGALLLGILASVGGALLSRHRVFDRRGKHQGGRGGQVFHRDHDDTHTTAPYPATTPTTPNV